MSEDVYYSIKDASEGIFKDRGSKFIAYAIPVETEEEIKEHLKVLKKEHHTARHHCFAFNINPKDPYYRVNDDGEPSGTAGRPIYGQIQSFNLINILVIVVRYFGGTLLGTSGLINAYRNAAEDCLKNAQIIQYTIQKSFWLKFGYEQMSAIEQFINNENITVVERDFREVCRMQLKVPETKFDTTADRLTKLPGLKIED